MNYLLLCRQDGDAIKFPLIKNPESLLSVIKEVTGLSYKDFSLVKIVIDKKSEPYKYVTYKRAFEENINNKVHISDMIRIVKLKELKQLEILRNSIVSGRNTNYNFNRYYWMNGSKKIEDFVFFTSEIVVKNNGKKKLRFFCKPKEGKKEMFRDLKNILTDCVKLEPEMLGVGRGLIESKEYFNDFNSMVKIDFKDFFNQVSYTKFIKGLRSECDNFLSEKIIKTIATAVCPYSYEKRQRATYQGLPTSTIASYIALKPLFIAIKKELKKYEIEPVIYIDDLCFKARDKEEAFKLKKIILDIIKEYKFLVNKEKCRVLYGNKCFFLGINMKTKSIPKSYIDLVKASLNNFYHGTDDFKSSVKLSIKGKLEYIKYINEEQFKKLKEHPKYRIFISNLYDD